MLHPDDYAALKLSDQWIEDILQEYEIRWLLANTAIGEHILDLGYGSGLVCKALHDAERKVVVVDGAAQFCSQAEDAGMLAFCSMFEDFNPGARFDTVIASFILEHVAEPGKLLVRAHDWADRLIVVVGNANSYHRQLAVKMGIQPRLDSLSDRDKTVGHLRVYDTKTIGYELVRAGWSVKHMHPLMFKPLPNAMLAKQSPELIRAMNEIECPPDCAANLILECRKF